MQHALTADQLRETCSLGDDARSWSGRLRILGIALLVVAGVFGYLAKDHYAAFQHSYLVAFAFFQTIALGALFFVIVNHTVGTKWNIAVRRIGELVAASMPLMALLFLPILIPLWMGNHGLYEWANHDVVAKDHVLHAKSGYLNVPFFTVRAVLYFAIWIWLARYYLNLSRAQDESGDVALTVRMRKLGPPALILFALSVTFAAFDWLMSLEPHWFSTIFGVYVFAGGNLAFFSLLAVITLLMQERGRLVGVVTTEHFHDIGKWMFAWTFFWGYVAFSQFMLIWYADLPEETFWYDERINQAPWGAVSLLLLFGHFLIPFCGLMSRQIKRNKGTLAFWAVFMLLMHFVDLTWLVMPAFKKGSLNFGVTDVCAFLGVAGLFAGGFLARAGGGLLAPVRDPYWHESLRFKNF